MIELTIPIKTISEANGREHWSSKARRAKAQREAARWTLATAKKPELPATVTLVRLAPGKLDDDNLAGAFKAIRDGVADAIGVDDGDPRYTWRYAQEKAKTYSVRIKIETN